jgi:hypothetical protein
MIYQINQKNIINESATDNIPEGNFTALLLHDTESSDVTGWIL